MKNFSKVIIVFTLIILFFIGSSRQSMAMTESVKYKSTKESKINHYLEIFTLGAGLGLFLNSGYLFQCNLNPYLSFDLGTGTMLLYVIYPYAQYLKTGLSLYPLGRKKKLFIKISYHPWVEYQISDFVNKYASSGNRLVEFTNLAFEVGYGDNFIFSIQYILPFRIRESYNNKIFFFGGIGIKYKFR